MQIKCFYFGGAGVCFLSGLFVGRGSGPASLIPLRRFNALAGASDTIRSAVTAVSAPAAWNTVDGSLVGIEVGRTTFGAILGPSTWQRSF